MLAGLIHWLLQTVLIFKDMATLTYAAFVAKYETYFADNTSQAIRESRMREFKDDIADSFAVSGGLNWVTVQIGDWDMDTNATTTVTHGVTDNKKIRFVSVIIRNDADTEYYNLETFSAATGLIQGSAFPRQPAYVPDMLLSRLTAGIFDDAAFNATSYNRGWVTIGYVS